MDAGMTVRSGCKVQPTALVTRYSIVKEQSSALFRRALRRVAR